MSVALRSTNATTGAAASFTITLPAGSIAGDFAVLFVGGGYSPVTPSGWTAINGPTSASNWNGGVFIKSLTSGDITTGSVTVSMGGNFDAYLAMASLTGVTASLVSASQNSGGSASVVLPYTGIAGAADVALYFGSNRANSTNTVSRGSSQQAGTDGANASGCLYAETLSSSSLPSATFSYSSAGGGNYQAIVVVTARPPNAIVTQTGLTALVPLPAPKAYATQAGLAAIVSSPAPKAYATQAGLTAIVPSVPPAVKQPQIFVVTGSSADSDDDASILPIRVVTVNTTVLATDYTVVGNTPSITITLPSSPPVGKLLNIKNGNSTPGQLITVAGGGANIDTTSTMSLGATASLHVQFDGTIWRVI
jgi:hypothetical protein